MRVYTGKKGTYLPELRATQNLMFIIGCEPIQDKLAPFLSLISFLSKPETYYPAAKYKGLLS
jgi:hypothetical protein